MKFNKLVIAMGTVVAMVAGSAYATDPTPTPTNPKTVTGGTIHFTGSLVDAACAVSTNSDGQTVELGQHPLHDFKKSGDKSELHPFTIKLEDCDSSIATTAAVAFTGLTDATSPELLSVNAGGNNSPAATGVGIQILDETSKVVKPDGSTFSTPHKLVNGENALQFQAQYVATSATPTAGQADADATFIMQYQ